MSDLTTFNDIAKEIENLLQERDRLPLNSSDLAKSIMIEGAELLEHYQRDAGRIDDGKEPRKKDKKKIEKEVADIYIYLFQFCLMNDIDPVHAIREKIEKIKQKYPVGYQKEGEDNYIKIKEEYRRKKIN